MKRHLIALLIPMLLFLLFPAQAAAASGGILDDTRIPDLAFRQALDARYGDGNHNVSFLRTEIDVSDCGITDLTGIELFTNLLELDCSGNALEGLNLDGCPKLYSLDCDGNPLATLNLGKLDALQVLSCRCDQLATLALPVKKGTLKILDISSTRIPGLDLKGCTSLEGVFCTDGALKSLDVSGCPSLVSVSCTGTPLTQLNVEQCGALGYIDVSDCALPSLSITGLESLVDLKCVGNPMTSLTISGCPLLETVDCSDCQLGTLSVGGCDSLYELLCPNNRLTSLNGIPSLYSLNCSGNRIAKLGTFPLLIELNCADNQLKTLVPPADLYDLNCSGNLLITLDLSACAEMSYVDCSNNALTRLEVAGLSELVELSAHGNRLVSLDIGGTPLAELDYIAPDEIDGTPVMRWDRLTIDRSTTLLRNGEIYYSPDGGETPLPTFFLPYGLTVIEDQAFCGIAAEAVLIPESVQTIIGDPFAGSRVRVIYGYPGSAAEDFAGASGSYTFQPIGQSD